MVYEHHNIRKCNNYYIDPYYIFSILCKPTSYNYLGVHPTNGYKQLITTKVTT